MSQIIQELIVLVNESYMDMYQQVFNVNAYMNPYVNNHIT